MRSPITGAFALGTLTLVACSSPAEDEPAIVADGPAPVENLTPLDQTLASTPTPALAALWVADGFDAPEGVALDPEGNYFISNVAGGVTDKDGNGYISVVYPEGDIAIERWADGLDAPKGMVVHDGTLYVNDIDMVRRYDMYSGAPFEPILVDGATFLNDATVWQEQVYVSDSRGNKIYRIAGETAELWQEGEALAGVNGLLGDGDRMLVALMGTGQLLSAAPDGALTPLAQGLGKADGIGITGDGGYLVSAWPGEIFYVSPEGLPTSVLNTRAAGISQNDLTMFGDIVIVPNMANDTVSAWRLMQ